MLRDAVSGQRAVVVQNGPVERSDLTRWVDGYLAAWASNDPERIAALFTDDAVYLPEPYAHGWQGVAAIVAGWLARKDEPGSFTFRWEPVAVEGDVAVIRGETRYLDPPAVYSNVWVIAFGPGGRCREFREWWMIAPAAG